MQNCFLHGEIWLRWSNARQIVPEVYKHALFSSLKEPQITEEAEARTAHSGFSWWWGLHLPALQRPKALEHCSPCDMENAQEDFFHPSLLENVARAELQVILPHCSYTSEVPGLPICCRNATSVGLVTIYWATQFCKLAGSSWHALNNKVLIELAE